MYLIVPVCWFIRLWKGDVGHCRARLFQSEWQFSYSFPRVNRRRVNCWFHISVVVALSWRSSQKARRLLVCEAVNCISSNSSALQRLWTRNGTFCARYGNNASSRRAARPHREWGEPDYNRVNSSPSNETGGHKSKLHSTARDCTESGFERRVLHLRISFISFVSAILVRSHQFFLFSSNNWRPSERS